MTLHERIEAWRTTESKIDSARRLVTGVVLVGAESKNGYRYSESALRQAVSLYEQRPVFIDHAAQPGRPLDRSLRDVIGTIVRARFEQGRVLGDIEVADTPAGRTFLALVEADTPAVGMSHVVLARKNADQTVVEAIQEVVSVDAVVFPATTAGLRSESFEEPPADRSTIAAEDRPASHDEVAEEAARSRPDSELLIERSRLEQQLAGLRREIAELESRREVERLLDEAALPSEVISEIFRQELRDCAPQHRLELIRERRRLVHRLQTRLPMSRARSADDSAESAANHRFIAAVRGVRTQ
jgi:hypothetical protein